MSRISSKVRELVNDNSVSDHYGGWGILTSDQRRTIRLLCDTCDNFEKTADILVEENNRLKKELELMKGGEG